MSDLTKRTAIDVAASAAGGTVGPTVTALMATAAAVTHNPDLIALSVPAGALADAMTEQGILLVTRALLNPAERVGQFADAVSEEAAEPIEDFIDKHVTSAREREFLGRVVDAATAAQSDWKTRVLARAFVRGAIDGDLIDETEMFIAATRNIEVPHARFLAAAHKIFTGPDPKGARTTTTTQGVLEADQRIGPSAVLLWRDLRDQGFLKEAELRDRGTATYKMTDLGFVVCWWLAKLGTDLDEPRASLADESPERPAASGG
ncbi:hypothetical protein ACQRWP_06730 [Micromonospora trifolii]|uniref:hypothetical protein n=1 Tax=Micromonospora trifolii TaxID=2911208 RepID=UPI003D2EAEE1